MATEARLAELTLNKLRVWNPAFAAADLDRPLAALSVDSLDRLEVVHLLERECQTMADLDVIMEYETFRDYINYFLDPTAVA